MAKMRIFVACGQETEGEKQLGKDVLDIIDENGMAGFFAEEVHSADELNTAVFKAINNCGGFCAIMHKRGEIKYPNYEIAHRSSVWIQQEIGILMYRRFLQGRPIPVRVFCERGILLEGIMKTSIINPIQFEKREKVLEGVRSWIKGPEFDVDPISATRERLFYRRIENLKEEDWFLLEITVAHSSSPGDFPSLYLLEEDFSESPLSQGTKPHEVRDVVYQIAKKLNRDGLIKFDLAPNGKAVGLGIAKQWWALLHDELRSRGRT